MDLFDDATVRIEAIRSGFQDSGISIAAWAREQGFYAALVYQVLEGERRCVRGQSHRIAVALGLKPGKLRTATEIVEEIRTQSV